jgi:hypothetical protein
MKLKDIDIRTETLNAHISMEKYGDRADKAERWVEAEIVRKMLPVMPRKKGNLLGIIQSYNSVINGSGVVRAAQDYGVYLYEGYRTVKNGDSEKQIPFNWTNPMTQPRWGHYAIETNKESLRRGVKRIMLGKEPDGAT